MALIEVFHVVASHFPIDATDTTDIPQGRLVGLDSDGQVALANGAAAGIWAIGIAGDSRSQGVTSYTPESDSARSRDPLTTLEGALVTGAWGGQRRFTQNRVADQYNEVLASGKMTVYHSGGEFWTSEYETVRDDETTVCSYTPGTKLYPSPTTGEGAVNHPTGATPKVDVASTGGKFTDQNKQSGNFYDGQLVGIALNGPESYPSGVPGTETGFNALPEGGNSLSWGQFLHVKLLV